MNMTALSSFNQRLQACYTHEQEMSTVYGLHFDIDDDLCTGRRWEQTRMPHRPETPQGSRAWTLL